jgi:hypothetical protein
VAAGSGRALAQQLALQGEAATILQGIVTVADPATGELGVNVGGLEQQVRWTAGSTPVAGDRVRVLAFNGELVVLPRIGGALSPTGTVTAYAAGAATCTVQSGGVTYTCYRLASYTPVVGDVVRLDWSEPEPFVLGKRSVAASAPTAPNVPVPPAPPGPDETGTATYPAIDSGYFSTQFGWSGSTSFGSRLMQGTSGGTNTGAWFYGTAPAELAGRTITGARVRVIRTNAYGAAGASPAHLYAHGSQTRPVVNVTLGVAAGDASLARGGEGTFPISIDAALAVIAGGGLAISGVPYLVLEGVRERANSGLLEIDWQRSTT